MQNDSKKIKSILITCFVAIIILFAASILLAISVHNTQQKIKQQEQEISELKDIINDYENLPGDGGFEITP